MIIHDLSQVFSRVRVRGANRVDFLHRMSSGNLLGIQPGEGRTTVFTTPIGRMVDYAAVLAFDDSLLLLCGGNGQAKVIRWLRKYIFFNDDVQISDESPVLHMAGIFGDGARDYAEELHRGAGQWARYTHRTDSAVTLVSAPPLQGAGYYVVGTALPFTGDGAPQAGVSYDDLRIRAGYPAFPNEISEDYIPLEAGLLEAISFTKGCYIGQEIIARMESRGQLAKRLVKLESDAAMRAGESLRAGAEQVGKLTSATSDGSAGLGYVRSAFTRIGQEILAADAVAHVTGTAGM